MKVTQTSIGQLTSADDESYLYRLELKNGELTFNLGTEVPRTMYQDLGHDKVINMLIRELESHVEHLCRTRNLVPQHILEETMTRIERHALNG